MDWTTLEWSIPGPEDNSAQEFLAIHGPLIRSALDEAAAAAIAGPAAIISVQTAGCSAAELPEGFVPLATFELLGTSRRPVAAVLDPTLGKELGGTTVAVENLGPALLTAIDEALGAVLGEGLGLGPADGLPDDEELLLIRLGVSSQPGPDVPPEVAVVAVMAAAAKTELANHLAALEALGSSVAAEPAIETDAGDALVAEALEEAGAPAIVDFTPAAMAVAASTAHIVSTKAAQPTEPVVPGAAATPQPSTIRAIDFPALPPAPPPAGRQSLDLLMGVNLEVTVEIGRARLPIRDVLALTPGSIVELDKLAGEKVDVLVNRYHVATGEVVVVDENFGVRITEVIARERRVLPTDARA